MPNTQVVEQSLEDQIIDYIEACPGAKSLPISVHKQFVNVGYTKVAINYALTSLVKTGSLELNDVGFLTLGEAPELGCNE